MPKVNAASAIALSFVSLVLAHGDAQARVHARFEPTDLELEDPGTLELDMQFGATTGDVGLVRGGPGGRLFFPDYELDIGLLPRLELDLDGAVTVEPLRTKAGWTIGEPLWASAKIGLVDVRDQEHARAVAVGVQLGPRLPIATTLHGAGYEALALVGIELGVTHVVVNAGALIDPANGDSRTRPYGIVGGLDVSFELDAAKHWSLLGEVGGAAYFAGAPQQLTTTAGVAWDTGATTMSLIVLASPIGESDRLGVLMGVSPKLTLF